MVKTGLLFRLSYLELKKLRSLGLVVNSDNLVIFVISNLLAGFDRDSLSLSFLGSYLVEPYSVESYLEYLILVEFYIYLRVFIYFFKVLKRYIIG